MGFVFKTVPKYVLDFGANLFLHSIYYSDTVEPTRFTSVIID